MLICLTSPKTLVIPPIPVIRDVCPNLDRVLPLTARAGSVRRVKNGQYALKVCEINLTIYVITPTMVLYGFPPLSSHRRSAARF